MEKQVREIIDGMFGQLVEIRRDFHRHPELGLEEFRTADKIETYLSDWGVEIFDRVNKTSVVGMVSGKKKGPVVGVRADIDALPIQQRNTHDYQSIYPGKMHACGHDVHTTIALGTAYVLHQLREVLPGSVKLLFQQAEEAVGGAKTMVEAGVLEDPYVDYVLGLHVCPKLEVGNMAVKYGSAYASSDTITIDIRGRRAHGAAPQEGVDAIVIASHVVMALQTLVSRRTSPLDSVVLSFGQIEGGEAHNVVASHVRLCGTLRTLDPTVRQELKKQMFMMVVDLVNAYGGDVALSVEAGYDSFVNDEEVTAVVEAVAKKALGEEHVVVAKTPRLGVEDFAYFAKERPSSYYRLGVANRDKGISCPLHHEGFDVDEEVIRYGVLIQVMSVLALFEKGGAAHD